MAVVVDALQSAQCLCVLWYESFLHVSRGFAAAADPAHTELDSVGPFSLLDVAHHVVGMRIGPHGAYLPLSPPECLEVRMHSVGCWCEKVVVAATEEGEQDQEERNWEEGCAGQVLAVVRRAYVAADSSHALFRSALEVVAQPLVFVVEDSE